MEHQAGKVGGSVSPPSDALPRATTTRFSVPPARSQHQKTQGNMLDKSSTQTSASKVPSPAVQPQTGPSGGKFNNFQLAQGRKEGVQPGISMTPGVNSPPKIMPNPMEMTGKFASNSNTVTPDTPMLNVPPMGMPHNPNEFMEVQYRDSGATNASNKATVVGVLITRILPRDSRFSVDDIQFLFRLISHVDPEAMVMNHKMTFRTARKVQALASKTLARMDYNGLMDIQSTPWGSRAERKSRSTMLFWIASDVIRPNLRELREDSNIQAYLKECHCTMTSTTLKESRSKVIGLFEGKDPRHSNRHELSARISTHLQTYGKGHDKRPIPVHVTSLNESGVPVLGFAVGISDSARVRAILRDHPFTMTGIILHDWKRTNRSEFDVRIQQHHAICKSSAAFKLQDMDPSALPAFRNHLATSSAKEVIIDVCSAVHSARTGVCYVQYLQAHQAKVLTAVQSYLSSPSNPPTSAFPPTPTLLNSGGSVAPTNASVHSGYSGSVGTVPTSRYADLLTLEPLENPGAKPPPAAIPRSIITTPPRSYSMALRAKAKDQDSLTSGASWDGHTVATPKTKNSNGSSITKSSAKTRREHQLETELADLQQRLRKMEESWNQKEQEHIQEKQSMEATHKQQVQDLLVIHQTQMTDMMNKCTQQMEALSQTVGSLQQQMHNQQAATSSDGTPVRKQPATKRPNNQPTPPSKSAFGTVASGFQRLTLQASEIVAPMTTTAPPANQLALPPPVTDETLALPPGPTDGAPQQNE